MQFPGFFQSWFQILKMKLCKTTILASQILNFFFLFQEPKCTESIGVLDAFVLHSSFLFRESIFANFKRDLAYDLQCPKQSRMQLSSVVLVGSKLPWDSFPLFHLLGSVPCGSCCCGLPLSIVDCRVRSPDGTMNKPWTWQNAIVIEFSFL